MTDIQAFITACVTNPGTMGANCQTWITANVAGSTLGMPDGGPGTACGNCIVAPNNNGGIWVDPNGFFGPNYAGCIQLTDATNGAACAGAFNNINGCDGQYCDQCQSSTNTTDYQNCTQAADGSQCSSEATAFKTSCATDFPPDGGASPVASCFPGTGMTAQQTDLTYVINMICGGGGG